MYLTITAKQKSGDVEPDVVPSLEALPQQDVCIPYLREILRFLYLSHTHLPNDPMLNEKQLLYEEKQKLACNSLWIPKFVV